MNIVYQDDLFCVVDKPEGHFVHPPEASAFRVPRSKICLHNLKRELRRPVFPVHRLDAATSGLVIFAFSIRSVRPLARLFRERQVEKRYRAVVRGHTDEAGSIDLVLKRPDALEAAAALTEYKTQARIELPVSVIPRYSTSRYSLVEIRPHTGRWHQIRRHFAKIAHPLIGDSDHGDSHHNRFYRDQLGINGLCLRADELRFVHPWTEMPIQIEAPPNPKWNQIAALFKVSDQLVGTARCEEIRA